MQVRWKAEARQGAQVRLGEERLPAAQTSAQVRRPCEEETICNNICCGEIIKQSVRDPKTVDLEPCWWIWLAN